MAPPNRPCDGVGASGLAGGACDFWGRPNSDPNEDPKILSPVLKPPDLVNSEFVDCPKLSFECESSCDVPNVVDVGCPCGVNEFAVDGGGPAGVVETLLQKL